MKEIDLRNSFLVLNADEQNTWRTNIQSVLLKYDQNKVHYSYLAKECRAEGICDSPFLDVGRYESVRIITYKGSYNLQTGYARRILKKNPTINKFYKKCDNEDLIFDNKCEIEYLNYDNVLAILKQNLNENIFLKVSYEFQSEKYSIITKCDYLNFPGRNNKEGDYIQPICGYILFEKDEKFFIGYLVKYIDQNLNGKLEFVLRDKTGILNSRFGNSKIKKIIKKIFNLLFDYVPDDFIEYVSINNSEVEFFKYKTLSPE